VIERYYESACYLQFDSYQQFPEVIHGIFTRKGGYSTGPYQGLNSLGALKSGENIDTVIHNRQLAMQALGVLDYPCVTLWNVHGAEVAIPDIRGNWRTDWAHRSFYQQSWAPESLHKADALITREPGVALALSFADCVPILLYDPIEHVLALVHGGWRGTARGIAIASVEAMSQHFSCRPDNIYAGLGPAIGYCCYEITESVYQLFTGQLQFDDVPTREEYRKYVRESVVCTQLSNSESLRLDLWETNRNQLLMAGVLPEHIELAGICTGCNTDRFFSHRKEHGKTGRFPVIVGLSKRNSPKE
jgi:YfiH family protein